MNGNPGKVILVALVLFLMFTSVVADAQQRTALVVGNSDYRVSPLQNPVHDSRDVADVLRKLGFTVIHIENAGQRVMETAIRKFGKLLRNGGVGLFYYAGHGMQVNWRNYLIPVDAEIDTESDVR